MKRSLLIFAILCLSSCGSVPRKPVIDLCAHNEPSGKVPCVNNQTNEVEIYDINQTDKWIMLKPDDWAQILYLIRKYTRSGFNVNNNQNAERIVKRELRKFIKANRTLNAKN